MKQKLPDKIYQYLLYFYDTRDTQFLYEFFVQCDIYIEIDYSSSFTDAQNVTVLVHPEMYKKSASTLKELKNILSKKLREIANIYVSNINIYPDLNKFQIIGNNYTPVITPWEEINSGQNHLIESLRSAKKTVDYQNIGNTSRVLLQNISKLIFNPDKHKSSIEGIDLSEGKFKNRLHTYFKCELAGQENKELRDFAEAVITTAEKSIDLANKLTHDLKANSVLAESCVISTIAAISIIKLVNK